MNIEIDAKTLETLNAVAAIKNMSVTDLLREYADEQETFLREKAEDKKTWEAAENGNFANNDTVMNWINTWGTGGEQIKSNHARISNKMVAPCSK